MLRFKKIVVLVKPHGQSSNQILQNMHFDSYCFDQKAIFLNYKYLDYSQTIKVNYFIKFLSFALNIILLRKVLKKLGIAKYHGFHDGPEFENAFFISNLTYVEGWYFRNPSISDNDRTFYTSVFNKKIQTEEYYENDLPLKVALHIRRGDYEFFLDGRYFLNDSKYIAALKNIVSEINEPFEIIIFGNDPKLNRDIYLSLGYSVHFSDGSIYQDYYRMSKCKILIGPSSTFSFWARLISNCNMKIVVIDNHNYNQVRLSDAL